MSELPRRIIIDGVITFVALFFAFQLSGSIWLGIGVFFFGLWNYYDGMTRKRLSK